MPPTRGLWSRFATITKPFFKAEGRWVAVALLGLLLGFILSLVGLNAVSGYMNRDFMTAVWERQAGGAVFYAALWGGVIAAITVVAAFKAFAEERLRLRWRRWLTRHLIDRYLASRAFYHLKARTDVDNPDQRITEDVKLFTDHALALLLIFTNSTITLVLFSGILWSISPWLFLAAVVYAVFGTVMTIFVGRKLVKYDVRQFKKEADLRYDLIQVRTHAEPVALLGGESAEKGRLRGRLELVVENMKRIIGLSRNINFFTFGYDYLGQLVPLAIAGLLFIRGSVTEAGEVTQAQMVFLHIIGAFSLIVKEFQRISAFGAVVERLGSFYEALDDEAPAPKRSLIETVEDEGRVAFEGLTLVTPQDGRVIVEDLTVEVPRGKSLLVLGPKGSGRTSILRAAAGLWTAGQGRVVRPPLDLVVFLPQQPYLRAGPLREQLVYATGKEGAAEEELLAALRAAKFQGVLDRVGGLDAERDWSSTLSLGEQQQLAFARLLLTAPAFAFLDEATCALRPEKARQLYEVLAGTDMTYISVGSDPTLCEYHDIIVELGPNGTWRRSSRALRAASA
jgi:putative ATP-binding cassette transporter